MKIFVLGSNGMLGRYVSRYLSNNFNVIELNRDELDASKVTEEIIIDIFNKHNINNDDVVINCIGTIKPQIDKLGDLNGILVNSVFPRLLANSCEKLNVKLIHPTTDCVYSGLKGSYNENDKYDVSDIYGMSKAIGEPNNCTVIRTSIIGEEVGQKRSLVEWVKGNNGNTVNGFTNHIWNGITCLQFAKICEEIINKNLYWIGIRHIHSNSVNKFELVNLINNTYDLNITVNPMTTDVMCDRSIATIYETINLFSIPPLDIQIEEMKDFYENLSK